MPNKQMNSLNSTNVTNNQMRYYIEPIILFSGIVFNLALAVIIYTKKRTKSLRSTKPLRYLLISMLVSDTWYLVYHVNVWYFFVHDRPDLSSSDVFCQLNTYLNYFFSIFLEFNMLSADYILLRIVFKSRAATKNRERGVSIYDQFHVKTNRTESQVIPKSSGMSNSLSPSVVQRQRSSKCDLTNTDENNCTHELEAIEIDHSEIINKQQSVLSTSISSIISLTLVTLKNLSEILTFLFTMIFFKSKINFIELNKITK